MVTNNEVKEMIESSEKNIINMIAGNTKIQSDKIDEFIKQITYCTDEQN